MCDCDAPTVPAVVLDPFAGTGTTLLVAQQQGQHGLGIELNSAYQASLQPLPVRGYGSESGGGPQGAGSFPCLCRLRE
jgi:hypothetical protein